MKKIAGFICSLVLLSACYHKEDIPVLSLLLPDSTTFNTSAIPTGKVTVLAFFSTSCEHCQDETIDLIRHMDAVRDIQFYFISIDSLNRIRDFAAFYELHKYSNITIGRDYTSSFPGLSGLHEIPSSLMYDEKKRLRVIINGGFTTAKLLDKIKQW